MAASVGAKTFKGFNGTTGGTTDPVTTSASGSTFLICASYSNGDSDQILTYSDNKGNTYTATDPRPIDGISNSARIFYCENGIGGSGHTATCTFAGTGYPTIHFIELLGLEAVGFDQHAALGVDTGPLSISTPGALAQADEIVISMFAPMTNDNPATMAETTGFTIQTSQTDNSQFWCSSVASKVVSSTAAVTSTWTGAGASSGALAIVSFKAITTPPPATLLDGGLVGHRRPVGRGPQMNRTPAAFKRSQGSQATRQVLLQLFSSPGNPLVNTSVTFYTAYNDAGAAIDGPLVRTTDSSGYVQLGGLNIAAVLGNLRYQVTGDPTKHRVSAVNFVI